MAGIGAYGSSTQNCRRQLEQLFPEQLKAPEPFEADNIPVLKKVKGEWVSETVKVSFFLPHDWFAKVAECHLIEAIFGASLQKVKEFWSSIDPNDPKLFNNPITDVPDWQSLFIPFEYHGDGAPHQKHDSLLTNSCRSLLATHSVDIAMLLISATPGMCNSTKRRCEALGVKWLGDTDTAIGKYIAWSMNALFDGRHPEADAHGNDFTDSYRKSVAGKYLDPVHNMRGTFWTIPADNEHNALHYGLPHYSAGCKCMDCPANTTDIPWNDVSPNAIWRKNIYSPLDKVLLRGNSHWLLSVKGIGPSHFGFDPMHCFEIGPAGTAVANVFFDLVYKKYTGLKTKRLQKLNIEVQECYKELGITDNKISNLLEYKHFSDEKAPHQNFPDIMHSVIKARQVRYLVPVAAELCKKYHEPGDQYSDYRLKCLQSLAESYQIVDRNKLFLGRDTRRYMRCIDEFVVHYAALHTLTTNEGRYQWPIRPKLHYIAHIGINAKWLSPRAFWCYPGESMVGTIASLAQSCLNNTAPHQVPAALCSKYKFAKHLQFSVYL